MMELKRCANCGNHVWGDREAQIPEVCISCHFNVEGEPSAWKPKVVTNADRIRAMSDEELAEILIFWDDDWGRWQTDAGCIYDDSPDHHEKAMKAELEWLKQPAEVE